MLVEDLPPVFIRVIAFIWGALWGSFFNVCIYRWPREMSVVTPPSHCPSCGAPVPGWRNFPILAYLLQRGRAACCGAKLTPRYVFVEFMTACIGVAIAERFILGSDGTRPMFDAAIEALVYFTFAGGLIIATFVDFEHLQIPDEVSIGGTAFALATMPFRQDIDVMSLCIGGGAAYLFIQLVPVWSWERITGQRGMGEGDAKFLMFIGLFLGWQGVLFVIAAASAQGAIGFFIKLALSARQAAKDEGEKAEQEDDERAEATGTDQARAEVEVDLPGRAIAMATREGEELKVVLTYNAELDAPSAPHIPFGPFLALAAIEFLFFGNTILEWYADTFFSG